MKEPILVTCNTCDLEGAALDWAVAIAEGVKVVLAAPAYGNGWRVRYDLIHSQAKYSPSSDWSQGGQLIDKHQVNLHSPQHRDDCWAAWVTVSGKDFAQGAYQPLISACRAVVASVLGKTVAIPKELLA